MSKLEWTAQNEGTVATLRFDGDTYFGNLGILAQVTEVRIQDSVFVCSQVIPRWVVFEHSDMESAKRAAEERLQKMCEEILVGLEGVHKEQVK